MRLLGVDFGGSRIGLAVADSEARLASPRQPVGASGSLARDALSLAERARQESADLLVLGLPLSMGADTRMSLVCRQLGRHLEELGLKVAYVDESLTSLEAEETMRQAGLKGSQIRRAVDGEAACRIIERYLEGHGA